MLDLSFDGRQRILLVRFSGVFSSEDLASLDAAALPFVAREIPAGAILDFSAVDAVAVPPSVLSRRGQWPQLVPGQKRVIVAKQPKAFYRAREYARQQREAGSAEPLVVHTLEEAYQLFDLREPNFEPVPDA